MTTPPDDNSNTPTCPARVPRASGEPGSTCRIAVFDDHTFVREGVSRLIDVHPGWELCGQGRTGREAVALAESAHPDVFVMDFDMPDGNGIEATRAILERRPETKIVMLTGYDPATIARDARDAGVNGLISKTDAGRKLAQAIDTVLQGGIYYSSSPGLAPDSSGRNARLVDRTDTLSAREKEIIGLIGEGHTSKVIAGKLGISTRTVETHRANIMRKLNLRSVVDVVRFAMRHGLTRS